MENIAAEHPYGYIKDGKVFLKPQAHLPEREIGIVKDHPQEAIKYFENRFNIFLKKVADLAESIDKAENKGSYLQKLLYLKEQCSEYDALGDFLTQFQILEKKEAELHKIIAQNKSKNLVLKNALLQELDALKDSVDWINASNQIKEIKNKWIRIGGVEKDQEEAIEARFLELTKYFYDRRQQFYEERNKIIEAKLQKYAEIADKAVALLQETYLKKAAEEVKNLKKEWRNVGLVPKTKLEPIMAKFKGAQREILEKYKQYRIQKGFKLPPAIAEKLDKFKALYARTEQILAELPIGGDDELRKMYDEWKKLGVLKVHEFKDLDNKFKANASRILDTYFMNKQAFRRVPNFARLAPKEQLRIKIGILKEMIERDRQNIENFENSFQKQEVNSSGNQFDKVFGSKLAIQKRNMQSKINLLTELEDSYGNVL